MPDNNSDTIMAAVMEQLMAEGQEGDVPMNVEIGSGQRRWGHG